MQALMVADTLAHVLGVTDGGEIQMLAPHEGGEGFQEPLACCNITCGSARLDICGALPISPLRLVIAFSRSH